MERRPGPAPCSPPAPPSLCPVLGGGDGAQGVKSPVPPSSPALPVTLRGPQLPSPSVISSSQEGEGQGSTIEAQDLWVSGGHASGGPLGWSTGFLSGSCHRPHIHLLLGPGLYPGQGPAAQEGSSSRLSGDVGPGPHLGRAQLSLVTECISFVLSLPQLLSHSLSSAECPFSWHPHPGNRLFPAVLCIPWAGVCI